ncbi:Tetratricopeptide repeat protein 27 [Trichinella papuae]|uniref:Tetratricopeptide repeat protein 27 n=1 Tax=Trichinella papuae TaxID=268474 RepID=A0A0V1MDY1_9BILA|nr:Tetratricopeptide repeat protein 27 [Trichinella papuae]
MATIAANAHSALRQFSITECVGKLETSVKLQKASRSPEWKANCPTIGSQHSGGTTNFREYLSLLFIHSSFRHYVFAQILRCSHAILDCASLKAEVWTFPDMSGLVDQSGSSVWNHGTDIQATYKSKQSQGFQSYTQKGDCAKRTHFVIVIALFSLINMEKLFTTFSAKVEFPSKLEKMPMPLPFNQYSSFKSLKADLKSICSINRNGENRLEYFKFGISCFMHFMQQNFLGPTNVELPEKWDFGKLASASEAWVLRSTELAVDGEPILYKCNNLILLAIAKVILIDCFAFFKMHFYSSYWWALRVTMIWQRLLKRPMIYLNTSTSKKRTPPGGWAGYADRFEDKMKFVFWLELSYFHIIFAESCSAARCLDMAKDILNERTDLANCFVQGKHNFRMLVKKNSLYNERIEKCCQFGKNDDHDNLDIVEGFENEQRFDLEKENVYSQCLLLVQMQLMESGLEDIHCFALKYQKMVMSILKNAPCWVVFNLALIFYCKYAKYYLLTDDNTFEKFDQFENWFENFTIPFEMRLAFCFISPFSIWNILEMKGEIFLLKGCPRDALEIYKSLDMLEDITNVCKIFSLEHIALPIIEERHSTLPSSFTTYCLGIIKNDDDMLSSASLMEPRKFVLPQLAKIKKLYADGQFNRSCYLLRSILHEQPLMHEAWFLFGMCWYHLKNHSVAANAFQRSLEIQLSANGWSYLENSIAKVSDKVLLNLFKRSHLNYEHNGEKILDQIIVHHFRNRELESVVGMFRKICHHHKSIGRTVESVMIKLLTVVCRERNNQMNINLRLQLQDVLENLEVQFCNNEKFWNLCAQLFDPRINNCITNCKQWELFLKCSHYEIICIERKQRNPRCEALMWKRFLYFKAKIMYDKINRSINQSKANT